MRIVLLRLLFTSILTVFVFEPLLAQNWMNGYNYRKKITIDKSKVGVGALAPYVDFIDFPVLIELEDADLKYSNGHCGSKIQNIEGKDISFALSTDPAVALSFQLESYNPVNGKLTCWVKIPSLSAKETASAATSIYLYYGSALLHEPYNSKNLNTWSASYSRIWHLNNEDKVPAESRNSQSNVPEHNLIGSPGITSSNFVSAKLNKGIMLNGLSESFSSGDETTSPNITISAWIKLNAIGTEQVIVTNKITSGANSYGYTFSINSAGKLVIDVVRGNINVLLESPESLIPGQWYYVSTTAVDERLTLFINAVGVRSKNSAFDIGNRVGIGGAVRVGSSKNGSQYFNGTIDELRIQNIGRPASWLSTEYVNQNNPAAFYSIGPEEYSTAGFAIFTGSVSSAWNVASNWRNGGVPTNSSSVVISSGKTAVLPNNLNLALNSLILEPDASLTINSVVNVNCLTNIGARASIKLSNDAVLDFASDVINNGSISLNQTKGTLAFSGNYISQRFSGTGITIVYRLENKQLTQGNVLTLEAPMHITGFVELSKGVLNANGQLTFLSGLDETAALLPLLNLNTAAITGNVNVQTYISGSYPSPATARGWRLLSSPVYTGIIGGMENYGLNAFKSSMFITGKDGLTNGFDSSPLNGGTVYTHDQSLPGTLSQKYIAVPNINTKISFGKGVYIFSRGNRDVPNAYINQIQTPPFSNPSGYIITHTGLIYTGDLGVDLYNKNANETGEGFNLLGNPYPAPIQWGSLLKTNLSSFVWLFDPLNNAYVVSNSASTIIPSGSGFFVKVLDGNTSGSLKFTETSKYTGTYISAPRLLNTKGNPASLQTPQANISNNIQEINNKRSKLTIQLKRDSFEQQYMISFVPNGLDIVNDEDAVKIGEGFVSIAGLVNGTKLSFDERPALTEKKEIELYTKGWDSGSYCLNMQGLESFPPGTTITLTDKYLNLSRKISASNNSYCFSMNDKISESWNNRFIITLDPSAPIDKPFEGNEITLFPNPVINRFYLKNNTDKVFDAKLTISNVHGQCVLTKPLMLDSDVKEVNAENLTTGIYLISIFDRTSNKFLKTFKVVKK